MLSLSKRCGIKIPKSIELFYDQKKNLLLLVGPSGSKTLLLNFKLFLEVGSSYLFVIGSIGRVSKKYFKRFCGTFLAELKQAVLELSVNSHVVLRLFGVGFKAYFINVGLRAVLQFKLGFSHFIFYKIPEDTCLRLLKDTRLFLSNSCFKKVTQVAAFIRSFKLPDVYKGKGILYNKETVVLKKGKKIT